MSKPIDAGDIYTITNGKYSAKYLVVATSPLGINLKRVMLPKTKIESVRLNENVFIKMECRSLISHKKIKTNNP